jgi:hypothetical protein
LHQRVYLSGFTTRQKDWEAVSQNSKTNDTINQELLIQKAKVPGFMMDLKKANLSVSATILKDLMTGKYKTETMLLDHFSRYIEEIIIRNEIKIISLGVEQLPFYPCISYSYPALISIRNPRQLYQP